MPIPIEVLRELMLIPVALACIKDKVVMTYLNAHPDQCELLLTDPVNGAIIVTLQAEQAHDEAQAALAALAAAQHILLLQAQQVPIPVPAPIPAPWSGV